MNGINDLPEEMAAFDKLPPSLQDAIRNAPVHIEAKKLIHHYYRLGERDLLKTLGTWIADWQDKNPILKP